jgi:tripartite-type tricarboxylate transporter receptor subunit TctC
MLSKRATALEAVAQDPVEREKLASQGITPRIMLQGEFDAYLKTEIERLGPIVKAVASDK